MSNDPVTAFEVYRGAWTDWSRGKVFGATLTLTRQDGALAIAFLAFFVALVGTRFWRLICSILHYIYFNDSSSNGVYHQRQAFLRNGPNPEAALWTIAIIGFSWRRNAELVWARLLPLFGMAVACLIGITLAGGFSSRVATFSGSNEVLLSGENCGFVLDNVDLSTYGDTEGPRKAKNVAIAEAYARQCYGLNATTGVSCNAYIKRQLRPSAIDTNATCPFDNKLCKGMNGNLLIDTGLLDSHNDLGRNTPPNQRLQFRRTIHCAPLVKEGYQTHTRDNVTNTSYATYHYGPMVNVDGNTTVNYTTRFSNDVYPEIEELTHGAEDTVHDFSVRSHYAYYVNGTLDSGDFSFVPIPEFQAEKGYLMVWFMTSGRVLFTQPTADSWYGPTTNRTDIHKLKISEKWGNKTMYRQTEPGSPLACLQREQYCWTGEDGQQECTPLQHPADSRFALRNRKGFDRDWLVWFRLTTFATALSTDVPMAILGTHVLVGRDKLNGPILGSIPEYQWQPEVQHWHATAMAHLQGAFLEPIIGTKDPNLLPLVRYPNSTGEKDLCANQKIHSDGFISFSIFSMACIFVGGGLIIVLSFALPYLLPCGTLCRRGRSRTTAYSKLEWSSNETFQLQRLAQEASGSGTWSGGTASVPVTKLRDRLAVLDVNVPTHPTLRGRGAFVNHGHGRLAGHSPDSGDDDATPDEEVHKVEEDKVEDKL